MSLDLLDSPVRLTWDCPGEGGGLSDKQLPEVARKIARAGLFFVTLQGRPLLCRSVAEVCDILSGSQLLLTCQGSTAELHVLAELPKIGCQLLLDLTSLTLHGELDKEALAGVVDALRRQGYEPVLAMTPLRKNLNIIPDLIQFCSRFGIAKFKLPNAHIGDSFHGYSPEQLPRWQDLAGFRGVWAEFARVTDSFPDMEIHDLFLWEIMTPDMQQNRSEYGGCQAANSLGHVDIQGVVHPCAAWPRPLGCLLDQDLEDIWSGQERYEVCRKISETPEGCQGCQDLGVCFGGCRGLAVHLSQSAGERDLMCAGPR